MSINFHRIPPDPRSRKESEKSPAPTVNQVSLKAALAEAHFFRTRKGSIAGAWIRHRCCGGEMCLKKQGNMLTTVDLSNLFFEHRFTVDLEKT